MIVATTDDMTMIAGATTMTTIAVATMITIVEEMIVVVEEDVVEVIEEDAVEIEEDAAETVVVAEGEEDVGAEVTAIWEVDLAVVEVEEVRTACPVTDGREMTWTRSPTLRLPMAVVGLDVAVVEETEAAEVAARGASDQDTMNTMSMDMMTTMTRVTATEEAVVTIMDMMMAMAAALIPPIVVVVVVDSHEVEGVEEAAAEVEADEAAVTAVKMDSPQKALVKIRLLMLANQKPTEKVEVMRLVMLPSIHLPWFRRHTAEAEDTAAVVVGGAEEEEAVAVAHFLVELTSSV
jgi:hypothetical protein